MPHDPEKYLYDMLDSCGFLIDFTTNKTVDAYIDDRGFRSAVERELQIIGEALMQLDKIAPEIASRISECKISLAFGTFLSTVTIALRRRRSGM